MLHLCPAAGLVAAAVVLEEEGALRVVVGRDSLLLESPEVLLGGVEVDQFWQVAEERVKSVLLGQFSGVGEFICLLDEFQSFQVNHNVLAFSRMLDFLPTVLPGVLVVF